MIISGAKFELPVLQNGGMLRKTGENPNDGTSLGRAAPRFDRFILKNIIEERTDTGAGRVTEMKKMLTEINNEEKQSDIETAVKCYSLMQNLLQGEIRNAESEIEWFNKLSEEKKYYQSLLDCADGDRITVNGGRYLLSRLSDGARVSRKDIEAAVSYVERQISDDLICRRIYGFGESFPTPNGMDCDYSEAHAVITDTSGLVTDGRCNVIMRDANRKYYNGLAEKFSKVSGIDIGLEGENSELFSKEGYTEDNFVEKTLERIEALKNTSQNLKNAMHSWLEIQVSGDGIKEQNMSAGISVLMKMRESFSDLDLLKDFENFSEENEIRGTSELK